VTESADSLLATIKRFRSNLKLYAAACLTIRDKFAKIHPLEFNEPQRIVHEKISKQLAETGRVRAIILKARQTGVSTYTAARFFRAIHLYPGMVAMVVADKLIRAGALYDIYARFHQNLPHELMPTKKSVQRERFLSFSHDSQLSVRPAGDTEAGRATTIHRLHASELAYWGNSARETWVSLMQAVPYQGSEVIVESTAKGAGGLFHELWEAAVSDDSEWLAIFLPWWIMAEYELEPDEDTRSRIVDSRDDFERQAQDEGIPYEGKVFKLSIRKLAWRRAVIVEEFGGNPENLGKDSVREFQQEYPATAEEAFLVSGSCFFDEDELRNLTTRTKDPETRCRLVKRDDDTIGLEGNLRGSVRIWDAPDKNLHYVIGADTAEGLLVSKVSGIDEHGGRDFSSASVVRLPYKVDVKVDGRKVGEKHYPEKEVAQIHGRMAPEVFAEQLRLLGKFYTCGTGLSRDEALIGVEKSHSSGQTVLRLLREHYHYIRLYWHRQINHRTNKVSRTVGWSTDAFSRMPMLDELGMILRAGNLEIPSKDTVREMVTFVVWENGKPMAEEGCHDDRVIALAIAHQMAAREHRHGYTGPMPTFDPGDGQAGMG